MKSIIWNMTVLKAESVEFIMSVSAIIIGPGFVLL